MRRFDFAVSLVCCALLGYFAWHAWKGPRGYPHQEALAAQVDMLQQKYDTLKAQREKFEGKVTLLRPESIDPDMLDEMARKNLELARPNEFVAFTKR
jgi:cell division protein FtsB